jgi:hypothetical protein
LHCSSSLAGFMTVINTVARSIKGVNGFYRQLLPSHSAPHVGWDIYFFLQYVLSHKKLVKCSLDFMNPCAFQFFLMAKMLHKWHQNLAWGKWDLITHCDWQQLIPYELRER